ncbi:hypothetical protein CUU62_17555 [Pseudomonas sp. WP001]|nr:hypothetical protein CUU62_17555 [Pseudomonas sp. WP001]RZI17998.1 hypothetical protein EUX53_26190 [Pseudomonas orientalis]
MSRRKTACTPSRRSWCRRWRISKPCCDHTVGASLLAKNSRAPRSFRMGALSLTSFASKLAPTQDCEL